MADARSGDKKTVLIVYAHWEPQSYNGSIKDHTAEVLKKCGHNVIVSDLYEMKFNPIISKEDIVGPPKQSEYFNYAWETADAYDEGRLAPDITQEQNKVKSADLVILQFPYCWMGFPAILKGWIDRIFCHNFACKIPQGIFDAAPLKGKKAMLSFTAGGGANFFTGLASMGDMRVNLFPLHNGLLRFCGFDVLRPQIFYGMDTKTRDQKGAMLERWAVRLETLFDEEPMMFLPSDSFVPIDTNDPSAGETIKGDVLDKFNKKGHGPTVGQHIGKPLPPIDQWP